MTITYRVKLLQHLFRIRYCGQVLVRPPALTYCHGCYLRYKRKGEPRPKLLAKVQWQDCDQRRLRMHQREYVGCRQCLFASTGRDFYDRNAIIPIAFTTAEIYE